ncbi:MAG: hypothetical protein ACI9KD_001052, partial [Congregibacter sp.]
PELWAIGDSPGVLREVGFALIWICRRAFLATLLPR